MDRANLPPGWKGVQSLCSIGKGSESSQQAAEILPRSPLPKSLAQICECFEKISSVDFFLFDIYITIFFNLPSKSATSAILGVVSANLMLILEFYFKLSVVSSDVSQGHSVCMVIYSVKFFVLFCKQAGLSE